MGQFSMIIMPPNGSVLSDIQQEDNLTVVVVFFPEFAFRFAEIENCRRYSTNTNWQIVNCRCFSPQIAKAVSNACADVTFHDGDFMLSHALYFFQLIGYVHALVENPNNDNRIVVIRLKSDVAVFNQMD